MDTKHVPEHPIEERFVCEECQEVIAPEEAIAVVVNGDEKLEMFLCKKCHAEDTDLRG